MLWFYDYCIQSKIVPQYDREYLYAIFINEYGCFLHDYAFTSYFMQMEASSKIGLYRVWREYVFLRKI